MEKHTVVPADIAKAVFQVAVAEDHGRTASRPHVASLGERAHESTDTAPASRTTATDRLHGFPPSCSFFHDPPNARISCARRLTTPRAAKPGRRCELPSPRVTLVRLLGGESRESILLACRVTRASNRCATYLGGDSLAVAVAHDQDCHRCPARFVHGHEVVATVGVPKLEYPILVRDDRVLVVAVNGIVDPTPVHFHLVHARETVALSSAPARHGWLSRSAVDAANGPEPCDSQAAFVRSQDEALTHGPDWAGELQRLESENGN